MKPKRQPLGEISSASCMELPSDSAFLSHADDEAVTPPKWQRAPSHLQQLRQLKACTSQKAVRDVRIEQLLGELVPTVLPQKFIAAPRGDGTLARRAAEDARMAASEAKTAVAKIREICGARSVRTGQHMLEAAAGRPSCKPADEWELHGKQWWEGHPPVRAWELGY